MKTTMEIQEAINAVYKDAILDLLADGPQPNSVVIQHLLGGMTHGEILFKEALAFVPAMAELGNDDKLVVYFPEDGGKEPMFALTHTVNLDLITVLPAPKFKGKFNDPSLWKGVTLPHLVPTVHLLDKDETDAIMARIMAGDIPEGQKRLTGPMRDNLEEGHGGDDNG